MSLSFTNSITLSQSQLGNILLDKPEIFIPAKTPVVIDQVDHDLCLRGEECQTAGNDPLPAFVALFQRSIKPYHIKNYKVECNSIPQVLISSSDNSYTMFSESALRITSTPARLRVNFETFIWNAIHKEELSKIDVEPRQILWIDDIEPKKWADEPRKKLKQISRKLKSDLPASHKLKITYNGELNVLPESIKNRSFGITLMATGGFNIIIYKAKDS